MTTADLVLSDWASTTAGKTARIGIVALGMITAVMALMLAPLVSQGSWLLVLAGVSLVATSVRAARLPTLVRLLGMTANLVLIPLLAQLG